jgi:hypothetical protein
MLVAANIFTVNFAQLLRRWKIEGVKPSTDTARSPGASQDVTLEATPAHADALKAKVLAGLWSANAQAGVTLEWLKKDYRLLRDDELGPAVTGDTSFDGIMVVYDWDTKDVVWQSNWQNMLLTPSGYCLADGVMYVNDVDGANIFTVDLTHNPGSLLRRISHPYLNDMHSLKRTKRGLLVTCSGTDVILEIDLQGRLLYEWWATEHGFNMTPSGRERASGRGQEHRTKGYHTRYHTTHLNDATFRDESERYLLALLFHQGQLVQIDRDLPPEEQKPEVLVDGLARPHGFEKVPQGWLLCNSKSHEMMLLDDDMNIRERITYDGGWIQDCTMLSNGRILFNDVDNRRLVEYKGPPWVISQTHSYPHNWRMGELTEIPEPYATAFRRAAVSARRS